ncbi:MAG: MBL fold metallo-hydrolase [Deltaproteobacteria bacterium]|jgi:glyoxylase-like metal-dependent hydrolase (beta-lactamase superfamily II)|nr:MAG: MBL fold metallo-hydrolase [Deltaproteobacteria bacterium]
MTIVAKDGIVQIERLELGTFGTNAYIVVCQLTKDSALVDAPGEAPKVMERLRGTNPRYILITHDHWDHLGALSQLKSELKVPIAAHPADSANLPSVPEILLNDGDVVTFGNVKLGVLHTPGHTPGSICFLTGNYLLSGDTIFPGGPGKTSSPSAFEQIVESITNKIFVLPGDTQIFPGHGDSTLLEREKQQFEAFSSRPRKSNLCGDVLWLS